MAERMTDLSLRAPVTRMQLSSCDVVRIMRLFVGHGHTACGPYMGRQRTIWFHDDLPFHMVSLNSMQTPGEREPLVKASPAGSGRRYDFHRRHSMEKGGLWAFEVLEIITHTVLYRMPFGVRGDAEQAAEDIMEALMRA